LNHEIDISNLQEMINQFHKPLKATALPVKTGDKIVLLRFENIVFLEAQNKYVYIFTSDGQKHLTDQSLSALVEKLPDHFYRIQKSYIINKERIKEMYRHFNGRYLFIMDDKSGTRLTSGRTYHDMIRKDFGL
jgi:two-component system LytT family response regulator